MASNLYERLLKEIEEVNKLKEKVKKINYRFVKGEFQREIRTELDSDVLNMVRSNWKKGYKANQERIGVYKSSSYQREKEQLNPSADGWVDLIYSGAFSSALFIPDDNNIINVDSADYKTDKLVGKYGDDIFDLSKDQEKKIVDEAKQYVIQNITNWLKNG